MAKKFDMAAAVRESLGDVNVSKVDHVQQIPSGRIQPNPANFYEMSDIEELAASIELVGLIEPIKVKPAGEGYTIIDGERRYRALTEVLGRDELPCIVRVPVNDVVEELMLIEANRTQRKMSAADLSKQAERYTELLAQLKEAGVAIPGRLRDRVAEALQVSSTKLARLHAIRENLVPELLAKFDAGEINESKAYEISKTPEGFQATLVPKDTWYINMLNIGIASETWENAERRKDEEPEPASKTEVPKTVTPSDTSWDAEAYLSQRQQEDDDFFTMLGLEADHFLAELAYVPSRQDGIRKLKERFGSIHQGWWYDEVDVKASPKGLELGCNDRAIPYILRTWTEVYDMLCIIALRRAAEALQAKANPRSESNQRPAEEWGTGKPEAPGLYAVRLKVSETSPGEIHNFARWTGYSWQAVRSGKAIDMHVAFWSPLPDIKKEALT